jgi:hypothetical protein
MHLPPFLVDSDVGLALLIVTGALITTVAVFFRIVIISLYSGSGRSGLIVALFHSAYTARTTRRRALGSRSLRVSSSPDLRY